MSRTARGVVYRKEDIDQASFQGVNNSLGIKVKTIHFFKYKGGVNCGHYWNENLYRLKKKTDGTYYEDKSLASSEEVDKHTKKFTFLKVENTKPLKLHQRICLSGMDTIQTIKDKIWLLRYL